MKTEFPLVELSDINPLDGEFLGFGAEWDSYAYPHYQIDETDFKLIEERIKWMRLPLCRIMMVSNWCYRENGTCKWGGESMRQLLRQLDLCESLGITVLLTDWGVNDTWLRLPNITRMDDPKYAEIIGTYLDYLINEKKYTCLKYFIFTNEPGSLATRDEWLAGLANVAAEFKKRGLDKKIRLAAPDQSGGRCDLLPLTITKLGSSVGAYDLHYYANQDPHYPTTVQAASSGEIRRFFAKAWKAARTLDPDRTKPLLIGEAGFWANTPEVSKSSGAANNSWNRDWRYGFFMAQYAIQAVEAGTWGISAWMLDDDSHQNFNWGLWCNKTENFALKPWFYVWSLLTRNFPPGSTFSLVKNTPPGMQILAAKVPATASKSAAPTWSLCLVNTGKTEAKFQLRLPGSVPIETSRYLYSEKPLLTDSNGFPKPVERFTLKWSNGEIVTCPPESVTFLIEGD